MSIRVVDFRRKRHTKRAKEFLADACDCVESLNCEVAGYAVLAWSDDGTTSLAFRTGGPVGMGGISAHISRKVEAVVRMKLSE